MSTVIKVENLSKQYRLGVLSRKTLTHDLQSWWARKRGNDDPNAKLHQTSVAHRNGEERIWALKDVSFEVKEGEVLGIIGKNGAGKSTLLKILSRVTAPTSGEVKVKGRVTSLLEVGTGFHPELTGRENIYLNGAILGMKRTEIERKFDEIVDFAGVEKFIDTPVKRYSSGMYVRLAFAVAAHLDPEILVVDEVLAVGDAAFQKKCLGKMGEVAQEGRTVLFVSHNMIAIRSLCERAILLQGGGLKEDGFSVHVVNRYLALNRENTFERVWSDQTHAPGNDICRLHGVCLRNNAGVKTSDIGSDHDFCIEIDYWNLHPETNLGITVLLINQEGTLVLSTISNHEVCWHSKPRPVGLFRSVCRIPGKLLNEGRYSVSVLVFSGNYSSVCREDECVEFEIYDTGGVRGDYFGGWSGIIRPLLEWNTKYLGN